MLGNSGNSHKSSKEEPLSNRNPVSPAAPQAPQATPQLRLKCIQRLTRQGRGLHQGHHGLGAGVGSPNVAP